MPKETGRPRDPEVNRRIVEAARTLLQEVGLDGLTISSVANRAGVGRPTVYRRYATPQDIAMDVFYADLDAMVEQLMPTYDRTASVLDQLMALADPFLVYYAENTTLSSALLQLSLFAEGDWQTRFADQAVAWVGTLSEALGDAKTDGRLHADVDTLVLVQTFFGLYLVVAIAGTRGLFDLDAQRVLLRRCLEQHLRGLIPRAAREAG